MGLDGTGYCEAKKRPPSLVAASHSHLPLSLHLFMMKCLYSKSSVFTQVQGTYDVRLGSCHAWPKCTNFITSQPSRIIFPSVGGAFGRRSLVGSQSRSVVCQIFALLLGGFCNRAGGTVPAAHVVYVSLTAQWFKVPLSCSLPALWIGQKFSAERGSLR